jgi:arginase
VDITLVCIPYQMDVARWGCARGPQAFLEAGLAERLRAAGHRVLAPKWIELPRTEWTRDSVTNLARLAARTADAVSKALSQPDALVIVLEGNCTHAIGAIGGLARAAGAPGVVWFDAHGDLNTTGTTTSGYLGGMPYAVALGWDLDDWRQAAGLEPALRPQAAALVGTSDLDPAEVEVLRQHPLLHMDARQLAEPDGPEQLAGALRLRAAEAAAWYLHIDVDVAGTDEVPGGLTPAPYWPPRPALLDAVRAVARTVPLRVVALASYYPDWDPERRGARLGAEMALAALGGTLG